MGRPARNFGGTGGHGCLPLPGERPNFHRHLLKDKTLTTLVKSSMKQTQKTKEVKILKPPMNGKLKSSLPNEPISFNKTSQLEKEVPASAKQKVAKEMLTLQDGTKQGSVKSPTQLPKKIEQSSDLFLQSTSSKTKTKDKLSGKSAKPVHLSEKHAEHSKLTKHEHTPKVKLPGCTSEMQSASKEHLVQQGEKQEASGPRTFILESVYSSRNFASAPFVNISLGQFFPANPIYAIPAIPLNYFVQPASYKQAKPNECNFEVPTTKVPNATMIPQKIHSEPEVQQSLDHQCDFNRNLVNKANPGALCD